MFETAKTDGRVLVPRKPAWVNEGLPKKDTARYFNELTRFYIVETPVERLSSSSVPLASYGWHKPWGKPEYLNRQMKDVMSDPEAVFSAARRGQMEGVLAKAGLLEAVDVRCPQERIAVYNNQKNQLMSVLYHVRNALCHGRFCLFKAKRQIWLALEDVSRPGKIDEEDLVLLTARMVLKHSTLTQWQKLVMRGPRK